MREIILNENFNYIGVFLSLGCNLSCSYCINHTSGLKMQRKHLSAKDWVTGLNRIQHSKDLPLSLQGGEPSIHPGFYQILNGLNPGHTIDLLTNIQFDPIEFSKKVDKKIFSRDLPYPSIRVSFHPEQTKFDPIFEKVSLLHNLGYSIGIFSVKHPAHLKELAHAESKCKNSGIIFKYKELLGVYDNKKYGRLSINDACYSKTLKSCLCKSSELLIAPDGKIYKCHHDLYNDIDPIGHILDSDYIHVSKYRECHYFGNCNPCDIKVKNNRFQNFGQLHIAC